MACCENAPEIIQLQNLLCPNTAKIAMVRFGNDLPMGVDDESTYSWRNGNVG